MQQAVGQATTYLGGPAMSTARPAILPCLIISSTTAAALRAFSCPTRPCDAARGSSVSASTPSPRMCECAAMRLSPRSSLLSETVTTGCVAAHQHQHQFWAYLSHPNA